jgi:RsmE family RNA methyltransferase
MTASSLDNKHIFAVFYPELRQKIQNTVGTSIKNIPPGQIHLALGKELLHRVTAVLRLKSGDHIELFDETISCIAEIITHRSKTPTLSIDASSLKPTPQIQPRVSLIFGLLKRKQCFEDVLESCGVYGAATVQPLLTSKTTSIDWYKAEKNPQRHEHIMTAAMEQAKQFQKPLLQKAISFHEWRNQFRPSENALNIFCDWDESSKSIADITTLQPSEINVIVGPEGDFTTPEKEEICRIGFTRTLLSPVSVLRSTEAIRLALGFLRCISRRS